MNFRISDTFTDHNEESLFVLHASFLGENDPDNTPLKAEAEVWATLNWDTSRAFEKTEKRTDLREGHQPPRG